MSEHSELTTPDCWCNRGPYMGMRVHSYDPENCADTEPVPEPEDDDDNFDEPD